MHQVAQEGCKGGHCAWLPVIGFRAYRAAQCRDISRRGLLSNLVTTLFHHHEICPNLDTNNHHSAILNTFDTHFTTNQINARDRAQSRRLLLSQSLLLSNKIASSGFRFDDTRYINHHQLILLLSHQHTIKYRWCEDVGCKVRRLQREARCEAGHDAHSATSSEEGCKKPKTRFQKNLKPKTKQNQRSRSAFLPR